MRERTEALMRIIVAVVSGIILWVWFILIKIFILVNFTWTLIAGKRIRDVAELSEMWNTQKYVFVKYMIFLTNERPFPFEKLTKNMSKYKK